MGPVAHQPFDQDRSVAANLCGLLDQARRGGVGIVLMRLGHVFIDGDVAIEIVEELADPHVEISEAEEALISQSRQDPALNNQNAAFDLGFVLRSFWAGRQDRRVVMFGECRKSGVDGRLEPQGLGNAGLEVVADDRFRYATVEAQSPLLTLDPVWQPLSEARIGEGVQRGRQNRDEDLHRPDLARRRINDGDGLASIVGLHRRAGGVAIAESGAGALFESGETLTEPCVSITVRVPLAIFLPQQRQRHALSLQLAGDLAPVGRVHILGWAAAAMEQATLQHSVLVTPGGNGQPVSPASRARSR